jgi:hypothetical protein
MPKDGFCQLRKKPQGFETNRTDSVPGTPAYVGFTMLHNRRTFSKGGNALGQDVNRCAAPMSRHLLKWNGKSPHEAVLPEARASTLFKQTKNITKHRRRNGNGGCPISLMLLLCWILIRLLCFVPLCDGALWGGLFCGCY